MPNTPTVRQKVLILIILLIAAGFLFLAPSPNNNQKKLTENNIKTNENDESKYLECNSDMKNDDLSLVLKNEDASQNSNNCLFVGCSGFSF